MSMPLKLPQPLAPRPAPRVLRRHPQLAAAHTLDALRHCVTAARLSEGERAARAELGPLGSALLLAPRLTTSPCAPVAADAGGGRVARQARHAAAALLSHALPPARGALLLAPGAAPQDAADALSRAPGSALTFLCGGAAAPPPGGAGAPAVDPSLSAFEAGGAFALASDAALELLDWLWPLTFGGARRAAALARQLHQRMCLEVEAAAGEAAAGGGLAPGGGGGGVAAAGAGGPGARRRVRPLTRAVCFCCLQPLPPPQPRRRRPTPPPPPRRPQRALAARALAGRGCR